MSQQTTTEKQELNIKLLRRIQKVILEEPRRMRMESWATNPADLKQKDIPKCNTVGCIAGWAAALDKKVRGERFLALFATDDIEGLGARALGIEYHSCQSSHPSDNLFYQSRWPRYFFRKLQKTKPGTAKYAAVVSEYIDYYITQYLVKATEEFEAKEEE